MNNYFYEKKTITYHYPDPAKPGKFLSMTHDLEPEKVTCDWCKSKYRSEKHEHCPNCGGPQVS